MHWYSHYIGDYSRKTAHLSMVEDGAYRRLLDCYYGSETALPTDVERLFRICRATVEAEKQAVLTVLKEFFDERPDGWHHERANEEIEKAREKSEKARIAGKISAAKRASVITDDSTDVQQTLERNGQRKSNHSLSLSLSSSLRSDNSANAVPASKPAKKTTAQEPWPDIPDWVPCDAWDGFVQNRKAIKHALTPRAAKLILKELDKLRGQGADPAAVLEQSTRNGWRDVFPVRESNARGSPNRPAFQDPNQFKILKAV